MWKSLHTANVLSVLEKKQILADKKFKCDRPSDGISQIFFQVQVRFIFKHGSNFFESVPKQQASQNRKPPKMYATEFEEESGLLIQIQTPNNSKADLPVAPGHRGDALKKK